MNDKNSFAVSWFASRAFLCLDSMGPKKADSSAMRPKFFKKLQTLPGINTRINTSLEKYHNLKHSTSLGKVVLLAFEMVVKTVFNVGLMMLFFTPQAVLDSKPGLLSCHIFLDLFLFIDRVLFGLH